VQNFVTHWLTYRAPGEWTTISTEDTTMTKYIPLLLSLTILATACDDDPASPGTPDALEFDATLTGPAERPDPVVTAAIGAATFTITKGSSTGYDPDATGPTTVTYSASVTGLSGPTTMAHIHGPAGLTTAAGIIVPLTVTSTNTTGTVLSGSFTSTGHATISIDSLVVLMRNGNSYVNIHTAANPPGEIRGQIVEDD
jgi:hypothetical protein